MCNPKYHIHNFRKRKFFDNIVTVDNARLRKHKNVCVKEYKCDGCNFMGQRNDHKLNSVCHYEKFHNCKQENIELSQHKCHMQWIKGKGGYCVEACVCNDELSEKLKDCCTFTTNYIFIDYEAQQNTGTHIPNIVIAYDF